MQRGIFMKLFIKKLFLLSMTIFGHVPFVALAQEGNVVASQPKISTPTIATLQEALFNVRKLILNFSAHDDVAAQVYEKVEAVKLVQCAKVLYDNAREQILQALQEMDIRLAYWRYQKSHQWTYFLMKNPIKWFTGPHQDMEIEHNIEQLQSHQGELYVLLGQLAEHGNVYDHELKTVFTANFIRAYAWIDELLVLLARIKVTPENSDKISPFIARATLLKLKLTKVRNFKQDILAEMPETKIPAHFERNWLKYITTAFIFGYGYKNIGMQQIVDSFESVKKNFNEIIVNPVQNTVKDVFGGAVGQDALFVPQEYIDASKASMKQFVNKIGVAKEEADKIIKDIDTDTITSFHQMLNNLLYSWDPRAWIKFVHGKTLLTDFLAARGGERLQKQYVGLGKIAVLTPALLSGWLAIKGYQAFATKDYSPIRRALVDINSLFVDTTKSLDDERYGKMIYLVYDLKKQAGKMIPVVDRADFIEDLHNIESKEFDVAAKRRIVDDMFRKYSFLKLS